MRDVGILVWVALVVIGVVSSIVSSAKSKRPTKGTAARQDVFSSPSQPRTQTQSIPLPIRVLVQQEMQPILPPVAPTTLPSTAPGTLRAAEGTPTRAPLTGGQLPSGVARARRSRSDTGSGATSDPTQHAAFPGVRSQDGQRVSLRNLLGSRHSLAAAVVAAEVLGKPLALRDEY